MRLQRGFEKSQGVHSHFLAPCRLPDSQGGGKGVSCHILCL